MYKGREILHSFLFGAAVTLLLFFARFAGADAVVVDTLEDLSDGDTSSVSALIASPGAGGHISLREAIEATNATPGADEITFGVSGRIWILTELPALSDTSGGTTIDGGGNIEILAIEPYDWRRECFPAFTITSSGNAIRGFSMSYFEGGVLLEGDSACGNTIQGCRIGLDTGTRRVVGMDSSLYGVSIRAGAEGFGGGYKNLIGGVDQRARNVIANTEIAIEISEAQAPTLELGNRIQGNYLGTDELGIEAHPNSFAIVVASSPYTTIGGSEPGAGNVICSYPLNVEILGSGASVIKGNRIGVNVNGELFDTFFKPREGIRVSGSNYVEIGGLEDSQKNIICGARRGVIITSASPANPISGLRVLGNFIGTDAAGRKGLGNDLGVELYGTIVDLVIGGVMEGAGNVISGNEGPAIRIEATELSEITIQGNWIGTNPGGAVLGNGEQGILALSSNNLIGGVEEGAGNVIAWNGYSGVKLSGGDCASNTIRGNAIYGNGGHGILLAHGANEGIAPPGILSLSPVSGTAPAGSAVEIFVDEADEGRISMDTVIASASGTFSSDADLTAYPGMNVTATATDAAGNTSAFGVYRSGEGEDCSHALHRGDTNEDGSINLSELLRLIQFYNSGGFSCAGTGVSTEDGYAPGASADHACCIHDSDYLDGGPDWEVSLGELLRFIQFFNSPGYALCDEGEDGFCVAK